jgi:hypothetical protein
MIAVIVLALPVAALTYFALVGSVILVVHNKGSKDIRYSAVVVDGNLTEHVTAKSVGAGSLGWTIFTPKLEGNFTLRCESATKVSRYSFGYVTPGAMSYWNVELNSCDGLLSAKDRYL